MLGYASLTASLTALLNKDTFVWTATASAAFETLKTTMSTTPVLRLPDFSLPFEVHTDATGVGVGVILAQQGRPITFFSKQLSPHLRASSTYSHEIYTITEAVHKWRQYLLGRRFTIITDHQSLCTMVHETVQTPEQQRWLTKLLGFDFDIIYKPGSLNGPADALSRLPTASLNILLATSKPVAALWAPSAKATKVKPR